MGSKTKTDELILLLRMPQYRVEVRKTYLSTLRARLYFGVEGKYS